MTSPDSLADRLEKAIERMRDHPQYEAGREVIALAPAILASLRRSVPASGEMGEARERKAILAAIRRNMKAQTNGERCCDVCACVALRNTIAFIEARTNPRAPSGETGEEAGS